MKRKLFGLAGTGLFAASAAVLLAFGLALAGCGDGAKSDPGSNNDNKEAEETFVAVTGITGVPTAAIMNTPLSLGGTVEPSSATNKTIAWSGSGVSNGKLTAPSAGNYTVTATITNGASKSASYTKNFTITAYDVGSGINESPFGSDEAPFIWTMDGTEGQVYVTIKETEWEAMAGGSLYNSGTLTRIAGTRAGQWTVGAGGYTGDTGLAIIDNTNGKMIVANFANQYSAMNGTFTKLDPSLTLEGTWQTSEPVPHYNDYAKIVAAADGTWIESISSDGSSSWREIAKGTYSTTGTTNPATWTITHMDTDESGHWVSWDDLSQEDKDTTGGSQTVTVFIYTDRIEMLGVTLQKQL